MTTRRGTENPAAGAGQERERLAQLGLEPGASAKQVAEAHAALIAYLAAAPRSVRPWARRRIADVEAAYAALQVALPAPRTSGVAAKGYIASDAEDAEGSWMRWMTAAGPRLPARSSARTASQPRERARLRARHGANIGGFAGSRWALAP